MAKHLVTSKDSWELGSRPPRLDETKPTSFASLVDIIARTTGQGRSGPKEARTRFGLPFLAPLWQKARLALCRSGQELGMQVEHILVHRYLHDKEELPHVHESVLEKAMLQLTKKHLLIIVDSAGCTSKLRRL